MAKLAVVDVRQEIENRATQPLTKAIAITAWWLMAITTPIVGAVLGLVYGIVMGAVTGLIIGVNEAVTDLKRWWEMYEEL